MQSKLSARALELLRARPGDLTLSTIASETGLSLDWLKSFASGRSSANASVAFVEKLYEYLAKRELSL